MLPVGLLDAHPPYWFTIIRPDSLATHLYDGVPRAAEEAEEARILLLEPAGEGVTGGAFVARYSAGLAYLGDTWYASRQAAVGDAAISFEGQLGPWLPVSPDESDPEAYVLQLVGRLQERGEPTTNER